MKTYEDTLRLGSLQRVNPPQEVAAFAATVDSEREAGCEVERARQECMARREVHFASAEIIELRLEVFRRTKSFVLVF